MTKGKRRSSSAAAPSPPPKRGKIVQARPDSDMEDEDVIAVEAAAALPPPPPHLKSPEDMPRRSGADLLDLLINDAATPEIAQYWKKLPAAVASQRVSSEDRKAHVKREKDVGEKDVEKRTKAILGQFRDRETGKPLVVPDREFLRSTGFVDATLASNWFYGVPSKELNGEVYNPKASPTMRLVGDIVPLPLVDTYFSDLHRYVSPSQYNHQDGATVEDPFLTTAQVDIAAAKAVYDDVKVYNHTNHRRRALPPADELRFTILNGREVQHEFMEAMAPIMHSSTHELIEQEYEVPFHGCVLANGHWADDGVKKQIIYFVREREENRVISAFLPVHHMSYYLYASSVAYSSASVNDRFYSLFGDLVRVEHTSAGLPTESQAVANTVNVAENETVARGSAQLNHGLAVSGLISPFFASKYLDVSRSSPLAPYLANSTSSLRASLQTLTRHDNRTAEERSASARKGAEKRQAADAARAALGLSTSGQKAADKRLDKDVARLAKGLATSAQKSADVREGKNAALSAQNLPTSHDKGADTLRNANAALASKGLETNWQKAVATRHENNAILKAHNLPTSYAKSAATLEKVNAALSANNLPTSHNRAAATLAAANAALAKANLPTSRSKAGASRKKSEAARVADGQETTQKISARKRNENDTARAEAGEKTSHQLAMQKRAENDKVRKDRGEVTWAEKMRAAGMARAAEAQRLKRENPPADVVESLKQYKTSKEWAAPSRGNAIKKNFSALGGHIEGVRIGKVTWAQMRAWMVEQGYFES